MDLISRKAAIEALSRGEGCGHICRDAIKRIPPVSAVPLDKLCELLATNADCPPEHNPIMDHCIENRCAECWKSVLKEWMEGQNATD